MTAAGQSSHWRPALPGVLLVLLVFLAYFPALRGEFLWDDDSNVVKSAPLRSLAGLGQIWFQPGATQQYYPLTHSSFWLDYHIWGLHTFGYHLENVLLHAATSFLLWLLLRRLSIKGAWLGAALFALHPVNVESVAWITERKNCLSGPFFMLSLLAAAKFWRLDNSFISGAANPRKYYFASLAFFLCALLSKTATIGLPAIILLLIWWRRHPFRRRDFLLLLPFVVIGVALALMTMYLEKNHLGATGPEWNFSFAQRCIIAGRAFWFYLGKLLWPHPLMFIYPLWNLPTSQFLAYAPFIAVIAGLVVLYAIKEREPWARDTFLAAAYFVVMLVPVLGFFNVVFYHYSFVCDHFQYLAGIGPLALIATTVTVVLNRLMQRRVTARDMAARIGAQFIEKDTGSFTGHFPEIIVYAILLIPLALLSSHRTRVFHDSESLWLETLAHNPNSWMAHDNLGICYSEKREFTKASVEYLKALEIRPEDYMAWNNLGLDAAQRGQLDEAINYFDQALHFLPNYALGHYNLGNALARKGNYGDAVQQFTTSLQLDPNFAAAHYSLANALDRQGKTAEAIDEYNAALTLDPDSAPAHANLGRVLAAKGDLDGAILQYRAALALDPYSLDALANLGNALVQQKHYDDAVTCYRAALKLSPNGAILHYNLAVALDRQGNKTESQKELAEASRLKTLSH